MIILAPRPPIGVRVLSHLVDSVNRVGSIQFCSLNLTFPVSSLGEGNDTYTMATSRGPELGHLMQSGQYSDLTLVCQGHEFNEHKVVVCSQSPVLAAAVRSRGGYEKSEEVQADVARCRYIGRRLLAARSRIVTILIFKDPPLLTSKTGRV